MRIFGTLGPACRDEEVLKEMFSNGMTGVRLNLSHTTILEASELMDTMHRAADKAGVSPELLIDMQGPELRIGPLETPLYFEENSEIVFSDQEEGDVCIPAEAIPYINEGQDLLLDDGKIRCLVTGKAGHRITARILRGGMLHSRKSLALPGIAVPMPAMTDRDRENLQSAGEYGVTGVMQPFVRSPEDLKEVRSALRQAGLDQKVRLLAKIENRKGLEQIESLIPWADEIVIARGDLGNAMDLWELPKAQKEIASACRSSGRDFMVVTQMLASMEHCAVPTRAEVSDIFNAVLDGAASVMVTGETAAGEYPAAVIRYLANTVRAAEEYKKTIV